MQQNLFCISRSNNCTYNKPLVFFFYLFSPVRTVLFLHTFYSVFTSHPLPTSSISVFSPAFPLLPHSTFKSQTSNILQCGCKAQSRSLISLLAASVTIYCTSCVLCFASSGLAELNPLWWKREGNGDQMGGREINILSRHACIIPADAPSTTLLMTFGEKRLKKTLASRRGGVG